MCVFVVWVMGPSFPLGRYLQVQPTNVGKNTNPLRHKFRPPQHTNTTSKGLILPSIGKTDGNWQTFVF